MTFQNCISFFGMFALMGIAWLFSADRKNVNWRAVLWGTALQLALALFVFQVPAGTKLFLFINDAVIRVMQCAAEGSKFVFGVLALSPGETDAGGVRSLGFILAFQAFPTIIFFSSLLSLLYFAGIMPRVIKAFARVFTKTMNISGAESLVATSNIFVGVEAALTAKPYLAGMSLSELCVVLTSGMATVASNILALYVFCLKDQFPTIAGHLVSASLLAAPASVLMAKLILPEDGSPETLGVHIQPHADEDHGVFEAVINGANSGVKMIVGISALLVAVLGLVALLNLLVTYTGGKVNLLFGWHFSWALKDLCGFLFYPLTLLTGISPADAPLVSRIIGERLIVTEVVAYQDLASAIAQGLIVDKRSVVIATYALCGFAHLASMAIFVGGTAALVPSRTKDLSRIAPRALLAATLACLMTACVAGTFYNGGSVLFGGGN